MTSCGVECFTPGLERWLGRQAVRMNVSMRYDADTESILVCHMPGSQNGTSRAFFCERSEIREVLKETFVSADCMQIMIRDDRGE